MIDPLFRVLARVLFLQNVDAAQIQAEQQPLQAMWKNLLEQVQRNYMVSTQPLKNAVAMQTTTPATINAYLNQIVGTMPKQLGNLFFSAYKCSCGLLVKKYSYMVYDDELAQPQKIHVCAQCKGVMQPITSPSVLAVVGNSCLRQIPCKINAFGEQYVLLAAFMLQGSQFSSFLLNEAATSQKSVGRYGVPFGERDTGLRESQKLLFGSAMQGPLHAVFYCKLSQIDPQLQTRLLQSAQLIDEKEPEAQIVGTPSAPRSPESTALRQEVSLLPASTQQIALQRPGGVMPQNVVRVGKATIPLYLVVALMFLTFFAVFCFFGDIALFVEIGKAKKRVAALETPPSA